MNKNFNYFRGLHEFKCTISKYKLNYEEHYENLMDVFHNSIIESLDKDVPDFYFLSIIGHRIKDYIKIISESEQDENYSLFDSDWSYDFSYSSSKDINLSLQKLLEDKDYILLRNKLDWYSNKELAIQYWITESWIEKRFTKIFKIIKYNKDLFEIFI